MAIVCRGVVGPRVSTRHSVCAPEPSVGLSKVRHLNPQWVVLGCGVSGWLAGAQHSWLHPLGGAEWVCMGMWRPPLAET